MKYFFAVLSLSLLLFSCKKEEVDFHSELEDITDLNTFETKVGDGVSLIFFHATWCSRCAAQRPAVEALLSDETLKDVFIGEVNFEKVQEIVSRHNVLGFPTILIFKDGEEKERFTGSGHSQSKLRDALMALL